MTNLASAAGVKIPAALSSIDDLANLLSDPPEPDASARAAAEARNAQLTKPAGALGRLEDIAVWYASWRGVAKPHAARAQALVFAGNHGVATRGVSPYPPAVTAQMVANFERGGAAINQLTDLLGVRLHVLPLDLDAPTADFTEAPAMSDAAFLAAVNAGWEAAARDIDCLILGEMGIGNTTAAAAVACALFGGAVEDWVGRGAGVDDDGLERKAQTVRQGVARHAPELETTPDHRRPLEALRRLGGREMAAILGAAARARIERIPLLLDGYIATASVAPLALMVKSGLDHALAGTVSPEGGHRELLRRMEKDPLLDLGLRLGEGSGAAIAFGVLQSALACHSGMATFEEAGVSGPE